MKKKLLLTIASYLITGMVFAQSALEGFYGQLGVGYQSFSDKATNSTFRPSGISTSFSQSITNTTPQGFAGNIALGYNYYALHWNRCLPFLLMLTEALKESIR